MTKSSRRAGRMGRPDGGDAAWQMALELEEPLRQAEQIRQALVWVGLGQLSVANDGGGATLLLADLLQETVGTMRKCCARHGKDKAG